MDRPVFTIRPSVKTGQTIEELSKLLGVTKNKLLAGILDKSQPEMEEMINQIKALEKPLDGGYSKIHFALKQVIIDAQDDEQERKELEEISKRNTIPRM